MQVRFLVWDFPLEEETATHSSISCLKNSMDRRVWLAIAPQRVAKSQTQLSMHMHTLRVINHPIILFL